MNFVKSVRIDLLESVCANLAAAIQPMMDHWNAVLASDALRPLNSVDWASFAAAARASAAAQIETAGVCGVVVMPGHVVPEAKADSEPRPNGLMARIGTISCGQALALFAICVLLVIYPELPPDAQAKVADDITVIVAAIGSMEWILRNR
jgi:hypothetical protein